MPPPEAGILWVSGLPAAGKTTLAAQVVDAFRRRGIEAALVDADEVRETLGPLGGDPRGAIRSMAYAARGLSSEGIVAVVAAGAPTVDLQQEVGAIGGRVFWVLADCPLAVCERRDPKGRYRSARSDPAFAVPGVGAPFEPPPASLVVATEAPVPAEVIELLVDTFLPWQREAALRR